MANLRNRKGRNRVANIDPASPVNMESSTDNHHLDNQTQTPTWGRGRAGRPPKEAATASKVTRRISKRIQASYTPEITEEIKDAPTDGEEKGKGQQRDAALEAAVCDQCLATSSKCVAFGRQSRPRACHNCLRLSQPCSFAKANTHPQCNKNKRESTTDFTRQTKRSKTLSATVTETAHSNSRKAFTGQTGQPKDADIGTPTPSPEFLQQTIEQDPPPFKPAKIDNPNHTATSYRAISVSSRSPLAYDPQHLVRESNLEIPQVAALLVHLC